MATKALIGVASIEYAPPEALGGAPTSWTNPFTQIVPDSVVMTFDEPEKTDIFVEGQDAPYVTIPDTKRVRSLAFSARDLEPDTIALFFGGSILTNTWSAPVAESALFYALKVISKTYDTTLFTLIIMKALILASMEGKFYTSETAQINVKADVQAVDNAGSPVTPITWLKTN